MKEMTEADQGFNAVFMMLDSGARGSKDQIKSALRYAWSYG
jgi:DNA-directed RNA polymerase subunit beta'